MDLTTQRRFLTLLAGVFIVGTVAAVIWSLSGFEKIASSDLTQSRPVLSDANDATPESITTAFDAAVNLRGPLYDPPSAVPRQPPKQVKRVVTPPPIKSKLDFVLVGTIIQSGRSVAIISDPSGNVDVKGVGESLDLSPAGVTVESIDSETVGLQFKGSSSTVTLDKSAKPKNAARRGNANRRRNP